MFPFSTSGKDHVGITRDHLSYYDIMRRLRSMFKLDLDLSELLQLGEDECRQLEETLEKISSSNREAKQLIDSVKSDYSFTPYVEPVDLDPVLDQTLEDILRNMPE